jgi:hypothetical protein
MDSFGQAPEVRDKHQQQHRGPDDAKPAGSQRYQRFRYQMRTC